MVIKNKEFQSRQATGYSLSLQIWTNENNRSKLRGIKRIWSNKKGVGFGFGWIFAIFVGGIIIFLAVYAVTNLVKTERQGQDVASAKEFGILLSPVETSLESGKLAPRIIFPSRSRVYNICRSEGNFGVQRLSVSSSMGIGDKYQEPEISTPFYNKYFFSPAVVEGKKFYAFSKPLNMPFKVADLVYIFGEDNYCLVSPPGEVEDELGKLMVNANVTGSISECALESVKICFGYSEPKCNVLVSFDSNSAERGIVTKNKQDVVYEGYALMYAAIFSDPELYECQIGRLMKRASSLSLIYGQEAEIVSARSDGCGSAFGESFAQYSKITSGINQSKMIGSILESSENLKEANDAISCKMF